MKRTFEFSDETSNKFWTIETDGNEFTVTFGKMGTVGQAQTKSFADKEACAKEVEKLIREKTKKGYTEQGAEEKSADEIFEQALSDDRFIPQFIEYQRNLRPGGGDEQLEQIAELVSDSDNGLRLLAACCVYAIDNQDIEENVEPWIEEYVGEERKLQEKLFRYMLIEAAWLQERQMPEREFLTDSFGEALTAMGIEYDEEALEEILEEIDVKDLPKLSSIKI